MSDDEQPAAKADIEIKCVACLLPFVWTAGEQEYFEKKGFDKVPKRCKGCRVERRAEMDAIRARSSR